MELHPEPWPSELIERVKEIVALPGEFECDPSPTVRAEIARRLDRLNEENANASNKKNHPAVSLPAVLSLMRHSQRERREKRAAYLDKHPEVVERVKERYRAGESILTLARELDAPPLALFKRLMLALKTNVPVWEMPARDHQQRADARLHDCTQWPERRLLHEEALRFEDRVAEALSALGVEYAREAEQRERGSRNTPDFLLPHLTEVHVGAKPIQIRWVDAKAYFGTRADLAEIGDQLERYARVHGPGLVVFRFGYDPALQEHLEAQLQPKTRRKSKRKNKSSKKKTQNEIHLAWLD